MRTLYNTAKPARVGKFDNRIPSEYAETRRVLTDIAIPFIRFSLQRNTAYYVCPQTIQKHSEPLHSSCIL